MYAKCGILDYAYRAFESIDKPDSVAWTALIAGCAYHGNASKALSLFKRMLASGARPNAITFVAVFNACSHSGLISEAKQFLETMSSKYGVDPTIDHYDCMIDIYSRAGQLDEAFVLMKTKPFEPDVMSWKSLLGGCSIHRNFELGKVAAEKLLELDPQDTAAYILLFNLHASSGNWQEAANVRKLMAERDLRKEDVNWLLEIPIDFITSDQGNALVDEDFRVLASFALFQTLLWPAGDIFGVKDAALVSSQCKGEWKGAEIGAKCKWRPDFPR
ncbi:hypothetical protein RJ639_006097 [Escallonia herrerae]|uniref:Pentatricopeptide repeat-containing protein n=1 Tax=Escallonia herrerae TaxID=1293975 RepID=A0AA88VVG6_9ASTE|nr:hypothetical protein RJ639_006097 [Escallonia herrerae]